MRIVQALSRRGDDVHLLGFGKPNDPHDYVHSICSTYRISLLQLAAFNRACSQYIEKIKPDIVLGLFRNTCLQTHYRAGNGCHKAYLERRKASDSFFKRMSFSINPLHRYILDCEKKTFESPDLRCLIVNSHLVRREIEYYYPQVNKEKIAVIHNGVEWDDLKGRFEHSFTMQDTLCTELGLKRESFKLLFIGNEWKRKGLGLLLEALQASPKNIELMVVGADRHEDQFKLQAKMLGLAAQVRFYGRRSDSWRFYSAADVCVIPSTYDPFANVTVEALAMGCFVISSNENGGSEVVLPGQTGYIFNDLQNPEQLADLIKKSSDFVKEPKRALAIRNSVQHLDFQHQLNTLIQALS